MTFMKLQLIEKGAIDSYKIIENEFNISLPKDYKEFLAKNNGAIVHDGYFFVEDLGEFILMERQFDLSGNRKVRVSDDFNIEFRLFRQDVVSDDTGDQVGDKIVDTAMSRVLYLTDIFEHIIDRFDQGSLSQ